LKRNREEEDDDVSIKKQRKQIINEYMDKLGKEDPSLKVIIYK